MKASVRCVFLMLVTTFFTAASPTPIEGTVPAVTAPAGLPPLNDIITHANSKPGGVCCAALSYVLGPKVVYPLSASYIDTAASFWSVQEQSVLPDCVVEPLSTRDVSAAVFVLSALSVYTNFSDQCKFAIKGGGHSPQRGAANQPAGVTIDLGALKQVDISADRKTTSIGSGTRWGDVYTKLDAQGLAVPGGRVAVVGVGGLTTGGGISFFSGRTGFVCDNVVNYELVLPFGKVVNVNASSSPDLFKALKGGSNNFGVVTRFDMKSFESGPFWGGEVTYPITTMPQQVAAFVSLAGAKPYDEYAALIHNYAYTAGNWVILNSYEYTKILPPTTTAQPYPPPPVIFKPFTDIQPQLSNTMRISNLTDFTRELALNSPPGKRALFITLTHGLSASLIMEIHGIADTRLQSIRGVAGLVYALSFQPLPTAITMKYSNGNNSLGLDASDGDLVLTLVTVTWILASDDAVVRRAGNQWYRDAKEASVKVGLGNRYLYLNYADEGQDVMGGYGDGVREGLRVVSRGVDEYGIFQKAVVGGFKL
ncbi:MAG: hypothetical protein Q9186_001926 [Xanthomendoza sp. 1 TL-2023]